MKNSIKQRLLTLALALALALTLAPTAFLAGNQESGSDEGGETVETPETPSEPVNPGAIIKAELKGAGLEEKAGTPGAYTITLEPNTSEARGIPVSVITEPNTPGIQAIKFKWVSSDPEIVSVSESTQDNAHTGSIFGRAPGEATVTITAGEQTCTIDATVSGIRLSEKVAKGLEVQENQSITISLADKDFELFGGAVDGKVSVSIVNSKRNVYIPEIGEDNVITIEGRQEGDVTLVLTVSAAGHTYTAEFPVQVTSNESVISWTEGVSPFEPLSFSALERLIANECRNMVGEELASIINITVSTAQGTIYHGYKSPDDTGAGAGSSITYYVSTAARGPYIKDLTFVPNASFTGEKATITFTGNAVNNRNF